MTNKLTIICVIGLLPLTANCGLIAYGICQTGCNAGAVACYAAGGYVFGTITAGAAIPATVAACNSALGVCMTACSDALLALMP